MRIKKKIKRKLFKLLAHYFTKPDTKRLTAKELKSILIIRQDNRIGNLLFTTSLVELIHKQLKIHPDILVGGKFSDLLEANPKVLNVFVYDQKQFVKKPWLAIKFLKSLKKCQYNLVIDCKDGFSFNNAVLTLITNAKSKIGFQNELSHRYLNYAHKASNENSLHESIYLTQP